MKTCSKCKVPKEETEFNKDKSRKDGLSPSCKKCLCAYKKEYYRKNRKELIAKQAAYHKENRKDILDYKRQLLYRLAPGDFERMFAEQGGVCAICSCPGGKKGLGVDHDHESGKIRALLCTSCNAALGHFKDSPAVVQIALNYLKLHGK